jgi:hypothetical protein
MRSCRILLASCVVAALTANTGWTEPPKPKDGPLGMKFAPLPKGTFYMGGGGGKAGKKTPSLRLTLPRWKFKIPSRGSFTCRPGESFPGPWPRIVNDGRALLASLGQVGRHVAAIIALAPSQEGREQRDGAAELV